MNSKHLRILEITWLIVGIVCVAGSIRSIVIKDNPRIWIFLIMAVISFGFALIRRNQRKRS